MKPDTLEALPRDVADLIASERSYAPPSDMRQRRMLNRIKLAIATTAAAGAAASVSAALTDAAPPAAGSAFAGGGALGTVLLKPALIVAMTAAAGISAGIAVIQVRHVEGAHTPSVAHRRTPTKAARRPVAPTSAFHSDEVTLAPAATPPADPGPASEPVRAAAGAPPHRVSDAQALLAAERALAVGRTDRVLAWAAAHARSNPSSPLAQERDALVIRALAAQGRHADARAQLEEFICTYPDSIHSAALTAALANP